MFYTKNETVGAKRHVKLGDAGSVIWLGLGSVDNSPAPALEASAQAPSASALLAIGSCRSGDGPFPVALRWPVGKHRTSATDETCHSTHHFVRAGKYHFLPIASGWTPTRLRVWCRRVAESTHGRGAHWLHNRWYRGSQLPFASCQDLHSRGPDDNVSSVFGWHRAGIACHFGIEPNPHLQATVYHTASGL